MKKRGFGSGKWNGFGGKIQNKEAIVDAAKRELFEESGIKAIKLEKVGELTFFFPHVENNAWDFFVNVFIVKNWEGNPIESDEMLPKWFNFKEIPFEMMWQDDRHWLPKILNDEMVRATFTFHKDNETITYMKMEDMK